VQGSERTDVVLSPSAFRRILTGATAVVALAGLAVEVLKSIYRWKGRSGVVPLFSLSHEQNVPTYYTAMLLLAAASMSALLATQARPGERGDRLAWAGLGAGFFYISVDEVLELHEQWGGAFRLGGVLHFGWVIPAACILVVLAGLYARFLRRLPPRFRNRLLLAGGIYVFGAVVMELPLGYWTDKEGQKNIEYALIDWLEETMEMAGIGLFLCAAFERLSTLDVRVRFGALASREQPAAAEQVREGPESRKDV
jgi:hypothetical protein